MGGEPIDFNGIVRQLVRDARRTEGLNHAGIATIVRPQGPDEFRGRYRAA